MSGRAGARARRRSSALVRLLVGGFVFVVGWFVGLALLWASERLDARARSWSARWSCPAVSYPRSFLLFVGAIGVGYESGAGDESTSATGAEINAELHRRYLLARRAQILWTSAWPSASIGTDLHDRSSSPAG